ncbi:MAG TPA: lysozyme [Bryobacteraceae bacterium]|jgi:lysozyme|nr:lysozyme [Bryobacteraceae bacterium]
MTCSQTGVELIKEFESLRLDAYLCPAGVWTIGWGHTAGVHAGLRITEDVAESFLQRDVAQVELGLTQVIHVPLTQGQYDALVSLCFNLCGGAQRLPSTAPKLVTKINSGDFAGAADEFLDIDRANGKVLQGLVRRRAAERALFLAT